MPHMTRPATVRRGRNAAIAAGRTLPGCLLAGIAALCLTLAATSPAVSAEMPARIQVDGETLVLNGRETRERLFVDLYSVGLYLPERTSNLQRISRDDVPKAFRVEILYSGDVPSDIPESWTEELLPPLSQEQTARLRDAYASLQAGDEIRIGYVPGEGTTVRLNDRVILSDPGEGLMQAFIDLWLGRQPVSKEIRNALLQSGHERERGLIEGLL